MSEPVHGVLMPETDKMLAVKEKSDLLSEFWDFLTEKYVLAQYGEYNGKPLDELLPANANPNEVLAEFFGIDLKKVNAEQKALLEAMRKEHDERISVSG